MNSRLTTVLALVVAFTVLAVVSAAAAPSSAPCTPAAVYDPACDANQDGVINVLDIQLAAGHWNQSGTWVSDNDHDHLGQTWIGSTNPLVIEGSFGSPGRAPLVLSNSEPNSHGLHVASAARHGVLVSSSGAAGVRVENAGGNGLYVLSAGNHGVDIGNAVVDALHVSSAGGDGLEVMSAGFEGVDIGSAGTDGVYVGAAGNPSATSNSAHKNGFEVAGAEDNGLYVGRADNVGVHVQSAGGDGVYVGSVGGDGVFVYSADDDGVDVGSYNLAGYFRGNIQVTGNCTGCLLATFGVNTGDKPLTPGDVVSLAGLRESGVDSVPMLLDVQLAKGGAAVVGVVQGWAELVTEQEPRPDEIGLRLVPREGPAEPGQYVTIAYSGLAQVKTSGPVAQGSKLAVGPEGTARAMRTVTVDGVELAENATAIGTALEGLQGDGLVWVLVNVQ